MKRWNMYPFLSLGRKRVPAGSTVWGYTDIRLNDMIQDGVQGVAQMSKNVATTYYCPLYNLSTHTHTLKIVLFLPKYKNNTQEHFINGDKMLITRLCILPVPFLLSNTIHLSTVCLNVKTCKVSARKDMK